MVNTTAEATYACNALAAVLVIEWQTQQASNLPTQDSFHQPTLNPLDWVLSWINPGGQGI